MLIFAKKDNGRVEIRTTTASSVDDDDASSNQDSGGSDSGSDNNSGIGSIGILLVASTRGSSSSSLTHTSYLLCSKRKRIDTLCQYTSTPLSVKFLNIIIEVDQPLEPM